MPEKEKIPSVTVLGPITPTSGSSRQEVLVYDNLETAAIEHAKHERERQAAFWNAEEGSLDEERAARQLSMQYLLVGALALNRAGKPDGKEQWSERYTQATSELYGTPDPRLAQQLHEQQFAGIEVKYSFSEVAAKVGEYLNTKYSPVYAALDIDNAPASIDSDSIAYRFEAALEILTEEYDEAWSEWSVARPDTDKLMVSKKTVQVGKNRANVTPTQLKELFTHEVLVHGLRAVNGAKHPDSRMRTGLTGYLDTEEGLGIFAEYAISGSVKDVVVDRYVDIAYAIGSIDGKKHSRAELVEYAMRRANERNAKAEAKKSPDDIEKEVYAHVNRIYRGSLGNEHVGVFTKDIAYYTGFIVIGDFIKSRLEAGESVKDTWSYLMSGKFDPTNERHIAVVNTKEEL